MKYWTIKSRVIVKGQGAIIETTVQADDVAEAINKATEVYIRNYTQKYISVPDLKEHYRSFMSGVVEAKMTLDTETLEELRTEKINTTTERLSSVTI